MPPRGEQEGERERGNGGTAEQILQDRYAGVLVCMCGCGKLN